MADNKDINVNLNFNTNADEAASEVNKLNNSIDKTNKGVDSLTKSNNDLNKSFEEVYGDLKPLTARMGEAEDRLYELALAGKTATDEYRGLLEIVGEYRRTQIETDRAVDAAATTIGQKLGLATQIAATGISAMTSGMALLGADSVDTEKALLKVQSAMAFADSISQLSTLGAQWQVLKTTLQGNVIVTKLVTAAQWLWNAAMSANPAGAIIAVVVALGAAIYTLTTYMMDNSKANESMINSAKENSKQMNELSKNTDKASESLSAYNDHQVNMAKASGKSSDEIRKLEKSLLAEEIELEKNTTATLRNADAKARAAYLTAVASGASDEAVEALKSSFDEIRKNYTDHNDKLKGLYTEQRNMNFRHNEEITKENKDSNDKILKEKTDASNKARDQKISDNNKAIEEEKKFNSEISKIRHDNYLNSLSDRDRELALIDDKYRSLLEKAREYGRGVNLIQDKIEKEKRDIIAKYIGVETKDREAADEQIRMALLDSNSAEIESIKTKYDNLIELAKKNGIDTSLLEDARKNEITEKEKAQANTTKEAKIKSDEESLESDKNKYDAYKSIASSGLESLKSLESAGIKNSKALEATKKGLALTQISFDTASALSTAVKEAKLAGVKAEATGLPGAGTIATIASYATSAAFVAGNIANARNILNSGNAGGGISSAGSSGVPTSNIGSAPNVSFVSSSDSQLQKTLSESNQNAQPLKTYVLYDDIENAKIFNETIKGKIDI